MKKIGIINGSLRSQSYSQMIIDNLKTYFPEDLVVEQIAIGDLPLYNPDIDTADNQAYQTFREKAIAMDAFVFVTPEYNRGTTAAMKNAVDVGSRENNVWSNKPALVISHSLSNLSGFGANHQLRQNLVVVNMLTMAQPELYLANIATLFDEKGKFVTDTANFLKQSLEKFITFAKKITA